MAFEIIVVGTSAGGLKALQTLLSALPEEFPLPVVMVQHRGKDAGIGLCEYLSRSSNLPFSEPEDKEIILPGHAYLAPRGYHLLVEGGSFALSTEKPVGFARPSIDVLFESAADAYQERAIGVILTGANRDGALGLAKIKSRGGIAVVEDPTSAASREMPDAALLLTKADSILPLQEIALCLQNLCSSATQRGFGAGQNRRVARQYGV